MGQCTMVTCSMEGEETRPRIEESMRIEYNGEKFIVPEIIVFDKQSTFAKVQQAARSFCVQNHISPHYTPMISRIIAYRHETIFQRIWNKLNEQEREQFLQDLNNIQHDLMDSFYYHFVQGRSNQLGTSRIKVIVQPKITREKDILKKELEQLRQAGTKLLQSGRVAAILMCAGSSSRFGVQDKFLAGIKGLSVRANIMDLIFFRLRKNTRGYLNIPIIINCNQFNSRTIQGYIKSKQYYGFEPQKFRYVITSSLAVFSKDGKYCMDDQMKLIRRPSGTANCAQQLLHPNIASFLKQEGVQYVYFSGLENLLQQPCDPVLLGMTKIQKRVAGVKCVNPYFHTEKLSRYYSLQGQQAKIEVFSPQNVAETSRSQILYGLPVAINSMVFQLDSLRQIIKDYNNSLFLAEKYRVIVKTQKVYDVINDSFDRQVCLSFEKDIRDIISCVKDPLIYKVPRNREYAPICSRDREYAFAEAINHFKIRLQEQLNSTVIKYSR